MTRRQRLEALAREAVDAQARMHLGDWLSRLTDDVVYRTIGTTAASDTWTGKDALAGLEEMVEEIIDGGIGMNIERVHVDDPYVVIEAEGRSETRLARQRYDNTYCLVLRFRGDLIEEWVEYLDTALVDQIVEIETRAQEDRHG